MTSLRSIIPIILFFSATARRSMRIDSSGHDAKQQNNSSTNSIKVREAFAPGGFLKATLRGPGLQVGALGPELRAPHGRFVARGAAAALHAAAGPEEVQEAARRVVIAWGLSLLTPTSAATAAVPELQPELVVLVRLKEAIREQMAGIDSQPDAKKIKRAIKALLSDPNSRQSFLACSYYDPDPGKMKRATELFTEAEKALIEIQERIPDDFEFTAENSSRKLFIRAKLEEADSSIAKFFALMPVEALKAANRQVAIEKGRPS